MKRDNTEYELIPDGQEWLYITIEAPNTEHMLECPYCCRNSLIIDNGAFNCDDCKVKGIAIKKPCTVCRL